MKQLCAGLFGLCLLGCAHQQQLSLSPVGPEPQMSSKSTKGRLVVFSAWRKTGTDIPDHRVHSSYDVLASDGTRLLHVQNYLTPMIEDPATVALEPGNYVVKARVQRYGFITVPVLIESGKTTALYLDDTTQPQMTEENAPENVQLPDGRIVGRASR